MNRISLFEVNVKSNLKGWSLMSLYFFPCNYRKRKIPLLPKVEVRLNKAFRNLLSAGAVCTFQYLVPVLFCLFSQNIALRMTFSFELWILTIMLFPDLEIWHLKGQLRSVSPIYGKSGRTVLNCKEMPCNQPLGSPGLGGYFRRAKLSGL